MKTSIQNVSKSLLGGLCAAAFGMLPVGAAHAQIFVAEGGDGVGEYNLDGSAVNQTLVTSPEWGATHGVAASGSNLFVISGGSATGGPAYISDYTISDGTVSSWSGVYYPGYDTINTAIALSGSNLFVAGMGAGVGGEAVNEYSFSLLGTETVVSSGLNDPTSIAASGSYLFVANNPCDGVTPATIGIYTTSAVPEQVSLISGLGLSSNYIAAAGAFWFVANAATGIVAEYSATGDMVNPALISGLGNISGIAVSGSNLFITTSVDANGDIDSGSVGEYTISGAPVNASLISGLDDPSGIAVVPEPSKWALVAGGLGTLLLFRRRVLVA